jgi:NTP pyrophosphatase (non-canonical NTP hydrolase)
LAIDSGADFFGDSCFFLAGGTADDELDEELEDDELELLEELELLDRDLFFAISEKKEKVEKKISRRKV